MNKTRPLNQVRSIEDAMLNVSSLPMTTPRQGAIMRNHWSIESMHWEFDVNLLQDKIKRKSSRAARNLDTIQRIVCSIFSAWRGRYKKKADKKKRYRRTDEIYLHELFSAYSLFSPKMKKMEI